MKKKKLLKIIEEKIGGNWHDVTTAEVRLVNDPISYHKGYNQCVLDSISVVKGAAQLISKKKNKKSNDREIQRMAKI